MILSENQLKNMESKAIFICKRSNDLKIIFSFNLSGEQPASAAFIGKIHFHSVTLSLLRGPAVDINKLQRVKGLDCWREKKIFSKIKLLKVPQKARKSTFSYDFDVETRREFYLFSAELQTSNLDNRVFKNNNKIQWLII